MDRTYHHGDLARAALDAAEALLLAKGENAVTMRAVASHVGVTHRALYRWYPNRTFLLATLAARGFERLTAACAAGSREEFLRGYINQARREPALYRLAMSRSRADVQACPALKATTDAMISVSLRTFGGVEPAPRDFVIALWSLLHGLISLADAGLIAASDDQAFADYALSITAQLGGAARQL
jgi:AcrR family transcriptional regulator